MGKNFLFNYAFKYSNLNIYSYNTTNEYEYINFGSSNNTEIFSLNNNSFIDSLSLSYYPYGYL